MTEIEWLACTDPLRMLDSLSIEFEDRRARLFAVACCRRVWHLLRGEANREAVEVAERFAEGIASDEELEDFANHAKAERPATSSAFCDALEAATATACAAQALAAKRLRRKASARAERIEQCNLLRCIFGNPFRAVRVKRAWLTWNGGCIPKLAQAIYDERAFDRLPILADALEEAGCQDQGILDHCRSGGEHVRGCWVVDLLLGKS